MMAPTHVLAGITLTGFIAGPSPSIVIASTLFSLLPDIDTPESFIGHKIPALPTILNLIIGHRRLTHSLIFLPMGYFLLLLTNKSIALAWLLGVGSHIVADMLTPQGVQLFWPFPVQTKMGFIHTGGLTEAAFIFTLLFINMGTDMGQTFWSQLINNTYSSFLKLLA